MTTHCASASPSASATMEKLETFMQWFKQHGGLVHDSVEFIFSPAKGVHMRVKRSDPDDPTSSSKRLPKGTRVASCPHALTYSALNVLGRSELLPRSENSAREIGDRLQALPQDLLGKARPQCVAAFGFAIQWLVGPASDWHPYISLLPQASPEFRDSSVNNRPDPGHCQIDGPLWWSEAERSWFEGTLLEKGVVDLESFWREEWDKWKDVMVPWAEARGLKLAWYHYKYALAIFSSRAFQSSQLRLPSSHLYDPNAVLYPGVDLLNHSPTTLNQWESDEYRFSVICDDEPLPGDEVHNFYGAKSNSSLFLTMGFVPNQANLQDVFALRLKTCHDQTLPIQIAVAPYDAATRPVEPSRLFQCADPSSSTYFIRRPERDYDTRLETSQDLVLNPHHPDYVSDSSSGFSGMPYSLIRALASTIALAHEHEHDFHRPGMIPSRLERQQCGDRLSFAITNLLLQRLRFEVTRLKASKPAVSIPELDVQSRSRFQYTERYRQGQIDVLNANIDALFQRIERGLEAKELVTIQSAVSALSEPQRQDFLAGLDIALGSDDLEALQESQDDIWALYLAFVFAESRAGSATSKTGLSLFYLRELYFLEDDEKVLHDQQDGDESEIIDYVNDLYSSIRDELPESSAWCRTHQSQVDFISKCVRAVRKSSITLTRSSCKQVTADQEGACEDDDREEFGQLVVFSREP